ncbi:MAG: pyridoxamine 5'-phosphate oxidase family protein [Chitinophagaceae bacterium]
MLGVLTNDEIEATIKSQLIGRVGCHADGITYVVPMSYAYDGEYVYGHSKEGMKLDMMRSNPEICFEVDDMADMANWRCVVMWGTFEELKEPEPRKAAFKHLVARVLPMNSSETTHLSPTWPFPDDHIETVEGVTFRIRITKKTGRFESNAINSQAYGKKPF